MLRTPHTPPSTAPPAAAAEMRALMLDHSSLLATRGGFVGTRAMTTVHEVSKETGCVARVGPLFSDSAPDHEIDVPQAPTTSRRST